MNSESVHHFLFELFDYADYLADKIQPGNPNNANYFVSLLYIEDMMDIYGRLLIYQTAEGVGKEGRAALSEGHRRIDLLRQRIDSIYNDYNFDEALEQRTQKLRRDWLHNKT